MENILLRIYMYLPVVALIVGIIYVFTAEDKYRYECQDPANWEQAYCQPPLCDAVAACTKDLIYNGEEIVPQVLDSGIDLTPEPAEEVASQPEIPIEQILNEVNAEDQNQ